MSSYAVKTAVWNRLAAWSDTRVIDLENKRNTIEDERTPWVAPQFVAALEEQIGLGDPGSRYWKETGYVHFLIAVPAMTGWKDCDTYAKDLAVLFRGTALTSDIVFGAVSPPRLYTSDEMVLGNWHVKAVLAEYDYIYGDPS